ncbi:MAG: acyl-CoA thioesterase [Acidobacteria bacterium]|nr:acyl-CoA thioesterase [Acidobacteriota bacterium]
MPLHAEISFEVPFHDVDSMGIVWHGHYLKYFEIARTALMRKAGLDLDTMAATGCAWPVVTCEIKYLRPLRYGQKARVEATLLEHEDRLKIAYAIHDSASGEKLTKATTVQLAVKATTGELADGTPKAMVEAIDRADRA